MNIVSNSLPQVIAAMNSTQAGGTGSNKRITSRNEAPPVEEEPSTEEDDESDSESGSDDYSSESIEDIE
ncbi:hypothetical protein L1987_02562 [Smallanthus sonchifolius]|uniref:Uncharacterized protein n=1 Tax=Smallanthus sonchifolius TaxID=185202 RepID=A0ACB9K8B3_9ASTR|nr:hypothetical protein L1987_02562 [Smallanthus sonchifolius]